MMDLTKIFDGKALTLDEFQKAVTERGMKIADLSTGKYVDKEKHERELKERAESEQARYNAMLEDLKKSSLSKEDHDKIIDKHQKEFEKEKADYANKIKLAKIEAKALSFNPKDVNDIMKFIDSSKVSIDGENLIGLDEQIKSIKESKSYLFNGQEKVVATSVNVDSIKGASGSAMQDMVNQAFTK